MDVHADNRWLYRGFYVLWVWRVGHETYSLKGLDTIGNFKIVVILRAYFVASNEELMIV